jgi:hypothetical protein
MYKLALYVFAIVASFALVFAVCFLVFDLLLFLVEDWIHIPLDLEGWIQVLFFVSSLGGAWLVTRRVAIATRTRLELPPDVLKLDRRIKVAMFIAYIATWALAVPAVQNENARWAMEEYARLQGENAKEREAHPYVGTIFAVPILPAVVLSYHEYHIAQLYAWSGWDIQLWYGTGTVRLFVITRWIS